MNWYELLKSAIGFVIPFLYKLICAKFPQFALLFGDAQALVQFILIVIGFFYSGAKAAKTLYIWQNRLLRTKSPYRTRNKGYQVRSWDTSEI